MSGANTIINNLGFRTPRAFQAAWNLGTPLAVDGIIGPKTTAAAAKSWTRHQRGQSDLSAHFSASEFRCHCGGKFAGCANVLVLRQLLASLETYRTHYGHPVSIVSGYRCPKHNAAVGGATHSQHLYGAAADLNQVLSHSTVQGWHLFAGIGYVRSTGLVAHVDRRDASGHNTTHSSTSHPALWTY